MLYNKDVETVSMPLPVDFTMLEAKTINGYDFEQLAHGMYAGCPFRKETGSAVPGPDRGNLDSWPPCNGAAFFIDGS